MLKTYDSFSSFHFGDTQTNLFSFKFLKLKALYSFDEKKIQNGIAYLSFLIFTEAIL